MRLAVARIGRPHGIKGEATVEAYTDQPERRFAIGNVVESDATGFPTLEISSARIHKGIWLLGFTGIVDRNTIESLRGSRLFAEVEVDEEGEEGSYHVEQLIDLHVVRADGSLIGVVTGVLNHPGQDLLEVDTKSGSRLIPLVSEFILDVDLDSKRITVELPEGLVD